MHEIYAANAKKYATNAADAAVTSSQKPRRKNSSGRCVRSISRVSCVRCVMSLEKITTAVTVSLDSILSF